LEGVYSVDSPRDFKRDARGRYCWLFLFDCRTIRQLSRLAATQKEYYEGEGQNDKVVIFFRPGTRTDYPLAF
jgi:hypothetical protein